MPRIICTCKDHVTTFRPLQHYESSHSVCSCGCKVLSLHTGNILKPKWGRMVLLIDPTSGDRKWLSLPVEEEDYQQRNQWNPYESRDDSESDTPVIAAEHDDGINNTYPSSMMIVVSVTLLLSFLIAMLSGMDPTISISSVIQPVVKSLQSMRYVHDASWYLGYAAGCIVHTAADFITSANQTLSSYA